MGTKLRCLICNDEIESIHRHDFKFCKCQHCFVDGGNDYGRYGFNDPTMVELYDDTTKTWTNLADIHAKFATEQSTETEEEKNPLKPPTPSPEVVEAVIFDWFKTNPIITTLDLKTRLKELGFYACQDDVSIQLNDFYNSYKENMVLEHSSEYDEFDSYRIYKWVEENNH